MESISQVLIKALSTNAFDSTEYSYDSGFSATKGLFIPNPNSDGHIHFVWRREDNTVNCEWRLNLNMVISSGEPRGFFTVCRSITDKPLLFDVNLLDTGFRVALADAMDRTVLKP